MTVHASIIQQYGIAGIVKGVFIVWVKLTRSYAIILKPLKIHAPPPI